MESTHKKRKLNQDEIPRITLRGFFRRDAFKISNMAMGESFPKTMHMLTMIINEQQTMPYYLSDELASKPYNHNLR
jgi:hypothetical protein